jgi:hypothetical protein
LIIVAVSDMHGILPAIPPCDLLLVAGDVCPVMDHSIPSQRRFLDYPFRRWLQDAPAKHVVGIAGNHDFIFEHDPGGVPAGLRWIYLQDSSTEIDGLHIYGTPWQPWFYDWAFNLYEPELEKKFAMIPVDTDILVCHGPPLGVGDRNSAGKDTGSPSLTAAIHRVRPRLTVFGHIHEGRGQWTIDLEGKQCILANVSVLDQRYNPVHPPMRFEI